MALISVNLCTYLQWYSFCSLLLLQTVPPEPCAAELLRTFLPWMTRLTRGQIVDWRNFVRLVAQQVYDEEQMTGLPPQQEEILKTTVERLEESGEVSLVRKTLFLFCLTAIFLFVFLLMHTEPGFHLEG